MPRNKSASHHHRLLILLAIVSSCMMITPSRAILTEGQVLMNFKNSLSNTSALANWNVTSSSPCGNSRSLWTGVLCIEDGSVFGLQLQGMGLTGVIDIDTLSMLPSFRVISLMNNNFRGALPDFKRLHLISVYLSYNQFNGDIPDDAFSGGTLKKVHLAKNGFSGEIPSSLVDLTKLMELDISDNQFSGNIPNFESRSWVVMNVANNRLEGQIPASLSDLDPADFGGNIGLCGKPLSPCKR